LILRKYTHAYFRFTAIAEVVQHHFARKSVVVVNCKRKFMLVFEILIHVIQKPTVGWIVTTCFSCPVVSPVLVERSVSCKTCKVCYVLLLYFAYFKSC